jgi:hypothetical protein
VVREVVDCFGRMKVKSNPMQINTESMAELEKTPGQKEWEVRNCLTQNHKSNNGRNHGVGGLFLGRIGDRGGSGFQKVLWKCARTNVWIAMQLRRATPTAVYNLLCTTIFSSPVKIATAMLKLT